jgi:hypothetical protein
MRAENRRGCATQSKVDHWRVVAPCAGNYSGEKLARITIKRFTTRQLAAAGIAPASKIPQLITAHGICVEQGCQFLHYVCTDVGLAELVPSWQRLTPDVRAAIVRFVRGRA